LSQVKTGWKGMSKREKTEFCVIFVLVILLSLSFVGQALLVAKDLTGAIVQHVLPRL